MGLERGLKFLDNDVLAKLMKSGTYGGDHLFSNFFIDRRFY